MAKQNKKSRKSDTGTAALSLTRGFFTLLGRSILTFFMVLAITGSIVAVCILVIVLRLVDTNKLVKIDKDDLSYTSVINAQDYDTGEKYELARIHGKENRIWVDYKYVPQHLKDAYVAIEDKRFYDHNGIDVIRTSAAAINMVVPLWDGAVHGGSTITQQLIKNITGEDEPRVDRKVQELFSAMNVDKNYSKETILEAYMNTIMLGNNTNGVQAASQLYFGKPVSDLTLPECAMLAGITKNPTKYDPSRHYDNAKERQGDILDQMFKQGFITEQEMEEALAAEVNIVMDPKVQSTQVIQNYFVDHVINEVLADFEDAGYTEEEAKKFIYSKGVIIESTMDSRIQTIIEEKYLNYQETFSTVANEEPVQSAFVVIDTHGKLLGVIGGTGVKDRNRSWNRATMTTRQPGSTIKPFAAYGLGIEYNLITYSSIFSDKELNINISPDQPIWSPKNYYKGFDGNMTVDMALQRSCNTIAVQVQQLVGKDKAFNFLETQVGITTLDEKDLYAPSAMALGAFEYGVTPLEWAGAYQIYANGGTYTRPYSYTTVTDANGNILLENDLTEKRVISEETAMIMNQMLQNVVYGPRGTGSYAKNITGTRVAGKTGTSNEDFDQWFVGMTPDYVAAVWLGYDRNKTVAYGGSYPPPVVWTNVMKDIQALAPEGTNFPVSSEVVQLTYCQVSGNLATDICTSTAVGFYKNSYRPPMCTGHNVEEVYDEEGNLVINEETNTGIIYEGGAVDPNGGLELPEIPVEGEQTNPPTTSPDTSQVDPNASSGGFIENE